MFPPFFNEDTSVSSLIAEFKRRGRRDLARRLDSCQKYHRPDLRDPNDVRRTYRVCGLVCCRWCIRKPRYQWLTGKLLNRAFANATNESCSFVTIHMVGRTLDELMNENRSFRRNLRNLRQSWLQACPQAAQIAVCAILEISADPTGRYFGHLHAIVHHPGIERSELLQKLRQQFGCEHQDYGRWINAKPLHCDKSLKENIRCALFKYALKKRLRTGVPRFPDIQAEAEGWLHLIRGGLRKLVTVLGPIAPNHRRSP